MGAPGIPGAVPAGCAFPQGHGQQLSMPSTQPCLHAPCSFKLGSWDLLSTTRSRCQSPCWQVFADEVHQESNCDKVSTNFQCAPCRHPAFCLQEIEIELSDTETEEGIADTEDDTIESHEEKDFAAGCCLLFKSLHTCSVCRLNLPWLGSVGQADWAVFSAIRQRFAQALEVTGSKSVCED